MRVVWAAGALVMILASTLGMDWFIFNVDGLGLPGVGSVSIDLRSMHMCTLQGPCVSVSFSSMDGGGMYPTTAQIAFWGNMVLAALVAWQCGTRALGGTPSDGLNKFGYLVGFLSLANAGLAGFMFAPETRSMGMMGVTVVRTWGPALLVLGDLVALIALYTAVAETQTDDVNAYQPLPSATARVAPVPPAPVGAPRVDAPQPPRARVPSSLPFAIEPEPEPGAAPAVARTKSAGPAIARTKSDPPALARTKTDPPAIARTKSDPPALADTASSQLRGKLKYAAVTAELTRAGIDARREDGSSKLVLWRDVVGVVARRLPAEAPYDGTTFVDLVSTHGSTLRVLPWTRLTGDPVEGEGEARARTLVQLVATRCPDIQIDGATRRFLGSHGPAAQLPDAATLAQHDERLA